MIAVVGLNHKSAPINIRERFALSEGEIIQLSEELLSLDEIFETVILSTCNRSEIYFTTSKTCSDSLLNAVLKKMFQLKDVDSTHKEYFYSHLGEDAVSHLFEVASGLDSMVLGENQILGQVKEAYRISSGNKFTRSVFNKLFHKAFEAGKRVRTATRINEGATSLSYAAVELAGKLFGNLNNKNVLLIGAGETGELVLQSLREREAGYFYVANRTFSRAEKIAEQYSGSAVQFSEFEEYLLICDIIISAVTTAEPILTHEKIVQILKDRKNPMLLFIDLSHPRSIDIGLKELETVFLYDLDDLNGVVAHNYKKRKNEIVRASAIVDEYVAEFFEWYNTLEFVPVIKMVQEVINSIKAGELAAVRHSLSEDEAAKMELFASSLTKKIQNTFIENIKKMTGHSAYNQDIYNTLASLFHKEKS